MRDLNQWKVLEKSSISEGILINRGAIECRKSSFGECWCSGERENEQQWFQRLFPLLSAPRCLCSNTRELWAAAKNMQQNCRESGGRRVSVYKRKNRQITILILLSCSREMFSTEAERVVLRAFRVNGTQHSHRPHMGIVHAYAHKHLQKQILFTGCLSKHLRTLHFTHSARGCFRTFMIVVQATLPDVKRHIM